MQLCTKVVIDVVTDVVTIRPQVVRLSGCAQLVVPSGQQSHRLCFRPAILSVRFTSQYSRLQHSVHNGFDHHIAFFAYVGWSC